jgi:trimethylamine--corrinoid protein Co-methyltransferase
MLESGVTFDYGQLVMDNEFAAMIKHVVNGIPVDDESLAVDVIDKVGPFSQFISEKHTFTHMKKMSQPKLIDRRVRDKWVKAGSRSMHALATDKAREIYENHKPEPLPEDVLARMRAIVARTEEEILEEQRQQRKK